MIFGELTFGGDVPLGTIAKLYRFAIPEAEGQMTLAEFVRTRLSRTPMLRDRIKFHDRGFVIQAMEGERITKIGLQVEPREVAGLSPSA